MGTLEQRLKFESGLPIGRSLVVLRKSDQERRALVEITARGVVRLLPAPSAQGHATGWHRVRGDELDSRGLGMIVWGARPLAIQDVFKGQPAAVIEIAT